MLRIPKMFRLLKQVTSAIWELCQAKVRIIGSREEVND